MGILHQIKTYFKKIVIAFLMIILAEMILLSFGQIIARKVFLDSIPSADQILTMSVMFMALLAAILTTLRDKHISIEMISNFVSVKVNLWMNVIANIASFIITLYLVFAAKDYLAMNSDSVEIFYGEIKTITLEASLFYGFLAMAFAFLINSIESIFLAIRKVD